MHLADLDDMDEEDALAVEAMIIPADAGAPCASPHASLHVWTQYPARDAYNVQMTSPVDTSLFTTTDPFYIQASQNDHPSTGFFARTGPPNVHSPFVMGTPAAATAWQR